MHGWSISCCVAVIIRFAIEKALISAMKLRSYATAGAGVEYAGVHLDFAWMFAGHECLARNTFWISLGYSF